MGTLYVVATPIGNLKDITLRAIETLREVHVIACEDTRVTKKLLTYYGIENKTLIPYHEHNEEKSAKKIVEILKSKDVALVSDAGTPCISDPGYRVVKLAIESGYNIVPVPGPFAGAVALSASGLPSDKFLFLGFLNPKKKKRHEQIKYYSSFGMTFIIYESPHRLIETLELFAEILPESKLVVAKELTKVHERFIRGTSKQVLQFFLQNTQIIKGEFVLLCYPEQKEDVMLEDEIALFVKDQKSKGMKNREILKLVLEKFNISKNKAYKIILNS